MSLAAVRLTSTLDGQMINHEYEHVHKLTGESAAAGAIMTESESVSRFHSIYNPGRESSIVIGLERAKAEP